MSDDNQRTPVNEIDFTYLTTDPSWGKEGQIPSEYLKLLNKDKEIVLAEVDKDTGNIKLLTDDKGTPLVYNNPSKSWYKTAMFTKDWRLGNLSSFEAFVVIYYANLSYDCLEAGLPESHTMAMERGFSIVEISHSKKGWFRKIMNTLRTENYSNELDPQKKSLFGGKRED